MKNKTNIIFVLSVLIILALINLYSTIYPLGGSVVNVNISESGFSVENLTIAQGTTVIWKNTGTRLHWPASNDHPTHGVYPDGGGCIGSKFDACRGLEVGEEYSFKFDVEGVWGVHDHLFPGLTMTVRVAPKQSVFNKSSVFERQSLQDDGVDSSTLKIMAREDPEKAWSYVKKEFIVDGQVVGNAHEYAHIVGNEAYKKFGLDGIKICDDSFAFGCFHGVTEAMLLSQGVKEVRNIQERCLAIFPPDKSQDYTGCIHGTGHGIYGWEGGDLKKSLLDCDSIDERYRQYCYDGVFMENSSSPNAKIFDINNPWKLCADLDSRYHRNCARYQSQIFLVNFGSPADLRKVGEACSIGPTQLLKETCFESLGYYVAQTSLGNVSEVKAKCGKMPSKEGIEICSKGSAIESVFQKYKNGVESAKSICNSLTEPERSNCLTNITNMTSRNVFQN